MHVTPFAILLLGAFSCPCLLTAQSASASIAEIQNALQGSWVGTLEYRDYSEPAASTKRVKLPTWLGIEIEGPDLRFRYIYDDGPAKTVKETSLIHLDLAAARYTVVDPAGKQDESYSIAGFSQLRQGRGDLTLTGTGTENKVAVDVRTTLHIKRNIFEIVRETSVPGQPLAFRHAYTFIRAAPPKS